MTASEGRPRTVPDTNVLLAAKMSTAPSSSPNSQYLDRWRTGELILLYSTDTYLEYIEKLVAKGLPEAVIRSFLRALQDLGEEVFIEHYHLPAYPVDVDDIAFLLCAVNGDATHLITYDRHLLDVQESYPFKICGAAELLRDLR